MQIIEARLLVDVMGRKHKVIDALVEFAQISRRQGLAAHSPGRYRRRSHSHRRALPAYRAYLVPSGSTTMEGDAPQTTRTLHERVVPPSTRLR